MARMTNFSFSEWTDGASEEEIKGMIKTVRARFYIFLLLGLIPFLNFVFMGLAVYVIIIFPCSNHADVPTEAIC